MAASRKSPLDQFADQAVKAREAFDSFDAETNGAINRAMQAYAKLAEEKPEEMFGLKPTERERYIIDRMLAPSVLRSSAGVDLGDGDGAGGDLTGQNPALIAGAIAKILSSEGGAKVIEEFLHHIRAEKEFFKETGADIIGWLTGGD